MTIHLWKVSDLTSSFYHTIGKTSPFYSSSNQHIIYSSTYTPTYLQKKGGGGFKRLLIYSQQGHGQCYKKKAAISSSSFFPPPKNPSMFSERDFSRIASSFDLIPPLSSSCMYAELGNQPISENPLLSSCRPDARSPFLLHFMGLSPIPLGLISNSTRVLFGCLTYPAIPTLTSAHQHF